MHCLTQCGTNLASVDQAIPTTWAIQVIPTIAIKIPKNDFTQRLFAPS